MNNAPWILLTRLEKVDGNFQRVTLYGQMFRKELRRMTKNGWSRIE